MYQRIYEKIDEKWRTHCENDVYNFFYSFCDIIRIQLSFGRYDAVTIQMMIVYMTCKYIIRIITAVI